MCTAGFDAPRSNIKYCSKRCKYRATHRSRRARLALVEREQLNLADIAKRDAWTCGICETAVDPSLTYPDLASASLDHVFPLALGGAHTANNVQLAHLECNRRKGATAA